MFKIRIWYENNTVRKNVPDALGIMFIKFGRTIECTLYNVPIEYFITFLSKFWCFVILVYLGSYISNKTQVRF